MTIVDFKTDALDSCICGFSPKTISIAYGATPYDIHCPNCKKQTTFSKYKVTENIENEIDYWNNHIAKMTIEEVNREKNKFQKRAEKARIEGILLEAYWYKGKGGVIHRRIIQ